ncbi:hypothetical protein AJ87_48925 [Rhizobium yanglingense]|nr:hypothetical protein AJ87_48925 [Rhizobium yanglingense]
MANVRKQKNNGSSPLPSIEDPRQDIGVDVTLDPQATTAAKLDRTMLAFLHDRGNGDSHGVAGLTMLRRPP